MVPLARGVAVAGDELLQRAGYRYGSPSPKGWRYLENLFVSEDRRGGMLYTRRSGKFWNVEWWRQGIPPQTLVILVDAYRTTDYVVPDRRHEVVIRIGKRSHKVDMLLARYSARSAVFITAWNPFSRSLTRGRNEYRQRCLLASLRARGCPSLTGEGRGADAKWPPEPSVLVFGVSEWEAAQMGRAWGQNAVVFVASGRAARLLLLHFCR